MYFFFKNKKIKKPIFKKRYLNDTIYKKSTNSIFFKNKIIVELDFFKKILYKLKRLYRKKKIKIFINLNRNHLFFKKPKNSRMGKGKGKFVRFLYRIKPFKPFIFIPKLSKVRLSHIKHYLNYIKKV